MGRKRQEFKRRNPMARELRDPKYRMRVVGSETGGREKNRSVDYCSVCGEEIRVGDVCSCEGED